jgi:copper chaperone CopZ
MSYYVHNVPGRIRIKNPFIKHKNGKKKEIQRLFRKMNGIESVSVNTATGSVVIKYDADVLTSDQLFNVLEYNEYFDSSKAIMVNTDKKSATSKAGEVIGKAVFSWTIGRVLDASGLSFISALI